MRLREVPTRLLSWLDAAAFDCRLGIRMLSKYPGLTLVGGFAMAVAIAIGATSFEVLGEVLNGKLPVEGGDRVVAIQYASENQSSPERRVLPEFAAWRRELTSIEQLGAFRTVQQNLVSSNAPPEPVRVAEITASGFALARTAPWLGRYLLLDDEGQGAQPALVIGFQAWQTRFGADPQVVGRKVNLGGVPYEIVGVMPSGFQFPVDHQYWTALRLNPLDQTIESPELRLFGRLAPGATIEGAQAELATIGHRPDTVRLRSGQAADPATSRRLSPRVLPYTHDHLDLSQPTLMWMLRIAQLLVGALAFVVAVNLAILVYARTVTRLGEIAVRTALGADRRRILVQLFIEAFALSVLGAGAGLGLAHYALRGMQFLARANGSVPFWIDFSVSGMTAIYALALAILAAVVMGVLPGLKATGRRVAISLHEFNSRTGTRLGAMWTTLVVAQVAVAVAVLPIAVYIAWQVARIELAGVGFAAEKFVVATVALGSEAASTDSTRIRTRQLELMSRLENEPGVSAVTYSSNVPGFAGSRRLEFDNGIVISDDAPSEVSVIEASPELADVYGAELVAGRSLTSRDVGTANTVMVNRTFAEVFLPHRSPLGVRFRYLTRSPQSGTDSGREWQQIVGVVRDFPDFPQMFSASNEPVIYHAVAPGTLDAYTLSVRFVGSVPDAFIDRFRQITADIDPALQLRRVTPLAAFYDQLRAFWRYLAWGIGLLTLSVLSLSAAGIYALMSFTVAQRTREIGIRAALGAHPRRLLLNVFARALRQLAIGVLIGSLLSGAVFTTTALTVPQVGALLLSVALLIVIIGLFAGLGPARRGLRIQAIDALRSDG